MHERLTSHTFATESDMVQAAAAAFADVVETAVRLRGRCMVALAGGSTPRSLYAALADEHRLFRVRIPWPDIHFFFGDERCVPKSHPDSNFRMADETLLARIPVPVGHVHRILTEGPDPVAVAKDYEDRLREAFHAPNPEVPRFDLVLLGLGTDGHTASLFPGSDALAETVRLAVATPGPLHPRITLTLPVFNHARQVFFLVTGDAKQAVLRELLQAPGPVAALPASLVRPDRGRVTWFVATGANEPLLAGAERSAKPNQP